MILPVTPKAALRPPASRVALPGARPNLLAYAETVNACFGKLSAVSMVKIPGVPVVAGTGATLAYRGSEPRLSGNCVGADV